MNRKKTFFVFLISFFLIFQSGFAGALRDLVESPEVKPIIKHNTSESTHYDYYLSIAAMFQDEGPYLKEWIEYHKLMGVEHFVLYNNLSSDNYLEVLQPYIDRQEVELIEYPIKSNNIYEYLQVQLDICRDAFNKALGKTKWLAIIDIDEFIVPITEDNLKVTLAQFDKDPRVGGICAAWVFFGTSHIQHLDPSRLMIEQLLLNGGELQPFFPWARGAYKSIFRPDVASTIVNTHYCLYQEGYYHVGLPYERMQINHYWPRDEDFLNNVKIPRRVLWGFDPQITESWADGMNYDTPFGRPILRFIPQLRQQMGLSNAD